MIDSHCHLADKAFKEDLDDVLLRAEEAGIDMMICIADSIEEGKKCLEIAEKHDHANHIGFGATQIYCTVGVHPHVSSQWSESSGQTLMRMIGSSPKVVAVGEIGLDYHYDHSPREVQKAVFREQLQIAKEVNLPVVMHNRESIEDFMKIFMEEKPIKAVLHCCTEKWEDVQEFVDLGYFLSFTGIATYQKSEEIRRTISKCPSDQMMIETDAPYLAPVPYRGKRNEPAFVREVAKVVAEAKGLSLQEVDEATTKNAVEFFGL